MRLPRTSLLSRLAGTDGPPVVLLEAPPGYGKSWLARRAAGPDVLRLRGGSAPLGAAGWADETVLLDDAHLLCRARSRPRRRAHRGRVGRRTADRRRSRARRCPARGHPPRRRAHHRRRRPGHRPRRGRRRAPRRIVDARPADRRGRRRLRPRHRHVARPEPARPWYRPRRLGVAHGARGRRGGTAAPHAARARRRRPARPDAGHRRAPARQARRRRLRRPRGGRRRAAAPSAHRRARCRLGVGVPRRVDRPGDRRLRWPTSCSNEAGRWRPSASCSTPATSSGRRRWC